MRAVALSSVALVYDLQSPDYWIALYCSVDWESDAQLVMFYPWESGEQIGTLHRSFGQIDSCATVQELIV